MVADILREGRLWKTYYFVFTLFTLLNRIYYSYRGDKHIARRWALKNVLFRFHPGHFLLNRIRTIHLHFTKKTDFIINQIKLHNKTLKPLVFERFKLLVYMSCLKRKLYFQNELNPCITQENNFLFPFDKLIDITLFR